MRAIGLTLATLLGVSPSLEAPPQTNTAEAMAVAAEALLESLPAPKRAKATFRLDDAVRADWHFIPRERPGLSLGEMDAAERQLAQALLKTGLSARGIETVATVISLEQVLFAMGDSPSTRNPEWYYVSVFGNPGSEPWGWRFEGHHVSLNFTVVEGAPVAWTPSFLGANPAEVRSGPRVGLRALSREEDLGRALARSLDEEQWEAALVATEAPAEVLTEARPAAEPLAPEGLPAARLGPEQRQQLVALLEVYLSRMEAGLAARRRSEIEADGMDAVAFAWAGSREPRAPHYYRIQGPSFLIEYDNVQNGANHVHTVWRDFDGDFGRDLLAEHYATHHRAPHDGAGHHHAASASP